LSVFISYSRTNADEVAHLVQDLEALGHPHWYDRELTGGQLWWDGILEQIRGCSLFVVVVSDAALHSAACASELAYARRLGKHVVPVIVERGLSMSLLPPDLRALQAVTYHTRDRLALLELSRALSTIVPPRYDAVTLPSPLPSLPAPPWDQVSVLRDRIAAATELTREAQSQLATELSDLLRDHDRYQAAVELIEMFQGRKDLLASTASQLRGLLAQLPPSPPVNTATPQLAQAPGNATPPMPPVSRNKDVALPAAFAFVGALFLGWFVANVARAATHDPATATIWGALVFVVSLFVGFQGLRRWLG